MTTFNDNFLRACRNEPVDHMPVWYMRQAGRYQPEYRQIKEKYSLMDIVHRPDICTEVTLLPVQQLHVDAAILFSDIMTPIGPMGIPNEIKPNVGPYIPDPIRTKAQVDAVRVPSFDETLPYVAETIKMLRQELTVPLIGFSGAPYTLASYIVEGGPSKHHVHTRTLMYSDPKSWHALMEKLSDGMADYLLFQARAGAQALQLFDSWVGELAVEDYRAYVLPHVKHLFDKVKEGTNVPLIHFGVNTGHLLEHLHEAGGDVIGLDWKTDIKDARNRLQPEVVLQGNLDNTLLFAPWELLKKRAQAIIDQVDWPGFIFNLGHGVTPTTQVSTLQQLTEFVHEYSKARIQQAAF